MEKLGPVVERGMVMAAVLYFLISKRFCRDHDAYSALEWAGFCGLAQPGLQLKVPLPESADSQQGRIIVSFTNFTSSHDIICESENLTVSSITIMDEWT